MLCGCSPPPVVNTSQPTTTLVPYISNSATPAIPATRVPQEFTPIPTLKPSPTPFIHVVQKDDTLLGIAFRYGVSMDDLLAANPGIDPRILSIDQEIVIPLGEDDPMTQLLPTATPLPLHLSDVSCYLNQADSFWCISTLENDLEEPLEAVSAILTLQDENGLSIEAKTAYSPLNLIPPGAKIPLAAIFSDFTGEFAYALIRPSTSFPAQSVDERYITYELFRDVDEPAEDFKSWRIEGRLLSKDVEGRSAARATILIVALDEKDLIIGFRKIKITTSIDAGETVNFNTEVFSLGPEIKSVEVYAEAPLSVEDK
jgi:LysM repeat protein